MNELFTVEWIRSVFKVQTAAGYVQVYEGIRETTQLHVTKNSQLRRN
jgi:hypothetical protein